MPKILLIIAGSYEQAVHYARENQLSREQWRYISGVGHLCRFGAKHEVVIYGTANERRDFGELLHIVKSRKFLIRKGEKHNEPRQCSEKRRFKRCRFSSIKQVPYKIT